MIRHLFALAFLPPQDIPSAFDVLKVGMPSEASDIVQWFEIYYVHGRVRSQLQNGAIAHDLPLFPPQLWSVYDSIELGVPRTQNVVEAWHNRWRILLGRSHVSIYMMVSELQKEQENVDVQAERILCGEPRPRQKKSFVEKERRIMMIVNDRGNRSLMDYLRGIAINLSSYLSL